ncbi:MAG: Fe-S metabolism protein SufE [Flavobacteriia bacterium]|nr:MAG: Fe-S metabolism protein SufE [Flavobacteriia bacterium]
MTIQDIQQEIIDEFSFFEDWTERYEYLIELGKNMPLIDAAYKTDDNLIKGCQSQVWLHAEKQDGKVVFTADSDAILTKGIVSLLLRVFTRQSPQDILQADTDFINKIGLQEHLSPTRANGLLAMLKQIKLYALALQ